MENLKANDDQSDQNLNILETKSNIKLTTNKLMTILLILVLTIVVAIYFICDCVKRKFVIKYEHNKNAPKKEYNMVPGEL